MFYPTLPTRACITLGKMIKVQPVPHEEIMKNIIFETNINLGAGNSCWLFLRGRKPLKKLWRLDAHLAFLQVLSTFANLTVFTVCKIGSIGYLHVIVLLLYNTVTHLMVI